MSKDPRVVAVQKVLYERRRLQRLKDDLVTIDVMMNLDPTTPLQPADIRGFAGSGPDWWIRGTGGLDPGVVEGAKRCDAIAAKFLAIRADLAHVAFPAADKAHLRLGLAELAAFWTARAKAWRAGPGEDVDAAVARMQRHLQASAAAFRTTRKYLKKNVRLG
jgi:hypothetical protein